MLLMTSIQSRRLAIAVCVSLLGLVLTGCGDFRSKTAEEVSYLECASCSLSNAAGNILIAPRNDAPIALEIETEKRVVVFFPGQDGKDYFEKMPLSYAETPDHDVSMVSTYSSEWKKPWFDPTFTITAKLRNGTPISATTDAGKIEVDGYVGNVYALTKKGTIVSEDCGGFLYFENWDGGIEATGVSGTIRARSLNGKVKVVLTNIPTAPIDLESSNGDVELTIPPVSGFDLTAEATGGSIRSDFELTRSTTVEGERMAGLFGSGGVKIRLTAKNGSIRFIKS